VTEVERAAWVDSCSDALTDLFMRRLYALSVGGHGVVLCDSCEKRVESALGLSPVLVTTGTGPIVIRVPVQIGTRPGGEMDLSQRSV